MEVLGYVLGFRGPAQGVFFDDKRIRDGEGTTLHALDRTTGGKAERYVCPDAHDAASESTRRWRPPRRHRRGFSTIADEERISTQVPSYSRRQRLGRRDIRLSVYDRRVLAAGMR